MDNEITYDDIPQQITEHDLDFPASIVRMNRKNKIIHYQNDVEPVYKERLSAISELRNALNLPALKETDYRIVPFCFITNEANELLQSDNEISGEIKMTLHKSKSDKACIPVYSSTANLFLELMALEIRGLKSQLDDSSIKEAL